MLGKTTNSHSCTPTSLKAKGEVQERDPKHLLQKGREKILVLTTYPLALQNKHFQEIYPLKYSLLGVRRK
jgi:hypothetical protein